MSGESLFDLVWLKEHGLAIILPQGQAAQRFPSAAIILKGSDGTDYFVPYDGYRTGAPIGFFVGRSDEVMIRVVGLGGNGEAGSAGENQDLAHWQLNDEIGKAGAEEGEQPRETNYRLIGFGERVTHNQSDDHSLIGRFVSDYTIEGMVDYAELLNVFQSDLRTSSDASFTPFFVTGLAFEDDEVASAQFLRPLHNFRFLLTSSLLENNYEMASAYGDEGDDQYAAGQGESAASFDDTSISKRYVQQSLQIVPQFNLYAGAQREQLDFVVDNGFQVIWRRQFDHAATGYEADPGNAGAAASSHSFFLTPFSERRDLTRSDDGYVLSWTYDEVVVGDVVGVVFDNRTADIQIDFAANDGSAGFSKKARDALFIFTGGEFVPLNDEVLNHPDNIGLKVQLENYIDEGIGRAVGEPYLSKARTKNCLTFFERDRQLIELIGMDNCEKIAGEAPFGPELELYRDHLLRGAGASDFAAKIDEHFGPGGDDRRRQSGLYQLLDYEIFCKRPDLAHLLVFNKEFREKFQTKQLWPTSYAKPIIDLLMGMLGFDDQIIDWAVNLRGEAQAILWQLCLKRPDMIEQLYELRLEPDMALDPFDEEVLNHAESALKDSSHVSAASLETKIIPILHSCGERERAKELEGYVTALTHGVEGKALRLGELTVCLQAAAGATERWENWTKDIKERISPLISPLDIELGAFEEIKSLKVSEDGDQRRSEILHLLQRLGEEHHLSNEKVDAAGQFIEKIEIDEILLEVRGKLDLALKYHHDLAVGVEKVRRHFEVSDHDVARFADVHESEWPQMQSLPPTFTEPIMRRQAERHAEFDDVVKRFAQKVHPNDALFLATLKKSLALVESQIDRLVWLERASEFEKRRSKIQSSLRNALTRVHPKAAKLRRSKSLAAAVRDMVVAERMGHASWPEMERCLTVIEKEVPKTFL